MKRTLLILVLFIVLLTLSLNLVMAQAETPVKIGFLGTLSGNAGGPGNDILDGFNLALEHLGGEAGGRPFEVIVRDDTLNTDVAMQLATELVETEQVDFVTGLVYSNVLLAVAPQLFESGTFVVSASAGPSTLAGADCSPYFFNMSYQNDSMNEAMGQYLSDQGYENVYVFAPDYSAGRDAINGFKRYFTGELAGEIYTELNNTDFSEVIRIIQEEQPDAVYTFQVPAAAIPFITQYSEAGLMETIPLFLPGVSADADTVAATGDDAEGLFNASHWALDLDNEVNARFVADFTEMYERVPTIFAAQGYDAALLIASAVEALGGDLSDDAAVQAALEAADFSPVRGEITFNNNHYPIQDVYLRQVVRDENGDLVNHISATIFEDHVDAYHQDCPLGAE